MALKAVKTQISFSFRTVEGQAKSAVLFGTMWCGCTKIDRAFHKTLTGKVFTKSECSQMHRNSDNMAKISNEY